MRLVAEAAMDYVDDKLCKSLHPCEGLKMKDFKDLNSHFLVSSIKYYIFATYLENE